MFCAISGKPLKTPVFSPKSRCVFEKSLIESFVQQNALDPINREPLNLEELVEIAQTPEQYAMSNSVNSATLKANYSIPNLLSSLQDEWDAIMLENFQLRQQLDASKVELSNALYKCDAAMNVATRATIETEKLKHELSLLSQNLTPSMPTEAKAADDKHQASSPEFPADILSKIAQKSAEFAQNSRKNKVRSPPCSKVSGEVRTVAELQAKSSLNSAFVDGNIAKGKLAAFYDQEGSFMLVSASDLETGIVKNVLQSNESISFMAPLNGKQILFGTDLGSHGVYDISERKAIYQLRFNEYQEIVMVSWIKEVSGQAYVIVDSSGAIALVDTVKDCEYDLCANEFATSYAHLHKDGLLLLQGNEKGLIVQNISQLNKPPIEFIHDIESEGPITSAMFASNGYWLVVTTQKLLKIFDLRKKPNTAACETLSFADGNLIAWDLEPSMKSLFVAIERQGQSIVQSYNFEKSEKKWVQNMDFTYAAADVRDFTYVWDAESAYLKSLVGEDLISLKLE
ncbi:LAFA_0D12442g1_1 [Lachancea sp. 'fantastica']|nr:LAFA_0D12442g1_1 [Lachancea sp. 'fantastica']